MLDQPGPQARSATRAGGSLAQPSVDVGDAGQPLRSQLVQVYRAVVVGPALRRPRQRCRRTPGAERVRKIRQLPRGARDLDTVERPVADVVRIGQDRRVCRRQPVPAGQRPGRRVVDLEQSAGRLVLQPFPDVPLVGAGAAGEVRGGRRAVGGQRPVQAQPLPQVHGEDLERADHVTAQPRGERLRRVRLLYPDQPRRSPSSCLEATVARIRPAVRLLAAARRATGRGEPPAGRARSPGRRPGTARISPPSPGHRPAGCRSSPGRPHMAAGRTGLARRR